jgi:hypothetical protein
MGIRCAAAVTGYLQGMTDTPVERDEPFEPDPENNEAPGLIPPDPDQPSGDRENMEPGHAGSDPERELRHLAEEAENRLAERDQEAASPAVEAEIVDNRQAR